MTAEANPSAGRKPRNGRINAAFVDILCNILIRSDHCLNFDFMSQYLFCQYYNVFLPDALVIRGRAFEFVAAMLFIKINYWRT